MKFLVIVTEMIDPHKGEASYQRAAIPDFNFNQELTELDRDYIKACGLMDFLQHFVRDVLEEREEHGLDIDPPAKIDAVLQLLVAPSSDTSHIGTNNHSKAIPITVEISDYQPRRPRCRLCQKSTPWFMGSAMIAELLLGSFLNLCQMEYMQETQGPFNLDKKTSLSVAITSAVLSFIWSLWEIFSSGSIVFLTDTGANLDKQCHRFWNWLTGHQPQRHIDVVTPSSNPKGKIAAFAMKSLFLVGFANTLYGRFIGDYTTITALGNTFAEQVFIPPEVYRGLQWLLLGLDHIDDPFEWASMIYFGFKTIDAIVKAKLAPPPVIAQPPVPLRQDSVHHQPAASIEHGHRSQDLMHYHLLASREQKYEREQEPAHDHAYSPV